MKKILVPTDFSGTAKNAFLYAQMLADHLGEVEITVMNTYVPSMEGEYPNIVPPIPELLKANEQLLDTFLEEGVNEYETDVATTTVVKKELIIGFPADEIVKKSKEVDLIVMGTTGASDVLNKMFGSVAANVAKRAECAVLMIPRGVEFQRIRQVLYAADCESTDFRALWPLLQLNGELGARLHFIHVNDKQDEAYSKSKEELFSELFNYGEPPFAIELADIKGPNVTMALNDYAENNDIDLIVMACKQRTFWDSIFHKSQSRRMAMHSKRPLMIYHY